MNPNVGVGSACREEKSLKNEIERIRAAGRLDEGGQERMGGSRMISRSISVSIQRRHDPYTTNQETSR